MVKKVTQAEFENEKQGLVLVDFYADWCGPCRMVGPVVEDLSNQITDVVFCKVNVDEENQLASLYSVRSIPTIVLFKDGKELDRTVGFVPKQKLEQWINSHK